MARMDPPPDEDETAPNRMTDYTVPDAAEFTPVPNEGPSEPNEETTPKRARRRLGDGKIPRSPKQRAPLPRWKDGQISGFCDRVYKAAGGVCLLNPDVEIRLIGQGLIDSAGPAGVAWEKVAKRHEIVRRFFERIMTTSDMGELFWAHLPILIPFFRRFGPMRGSFEGLQEEFADEYARAESESAAA